MAVGRRGARRRSRSRQRW